MTPSVTPISALAVLVKTAVAAVKLRSASWQKLVLTLPLLAACQRAAVATAAPPTLTGLPAPAFSPRVQQLLAQMTLKEKIG